MANSYLTKTFSGAPTNAKKGTFSGWFKLSSGSDSYYRMFVSGPDQNNRTDINITNPVNSSNALAGEINVQHYISGTGYFLVTNRCLRDLNGWYHILVSYDTTLATGSDRVKLYVNGTRETSFSTSDMNNIPQNTDLYWGNNSSAHHIGNSPHFSPRFFNGYMSHVAFVDGTALTPTSFGETDSTSGIWKFKNPTGVTWGNNGFHLKFENSGALGTDSSGNSNTFAVNGNLKQALDTPSNVYVTLNPLDFGGTSTSNASLSNGNTTPVSGSAAWKHSHGTLGMATGKWYWEAKQIGTGSGSTGHIYGICDQQYNTDDDPNNGTPNAKFYGRQGGIIYNNDNGANQTFFTPVPSDGDILMIAFDATNGKLWFGLNGTWQNSNGSSGNTSYASTTLNPSYPDFTGLTVDTSKAGIYVPNFASYGSGSMYVNFGNGFFGTTAITSAGSNGNGSLFEYDVPSGFYALNTKNINTYG